MIRVAALTSQIKAPASPRSAWGGDDAPSSAFRRSFARLRIWPAESRATAALVLRGKRRS